jgi:hypothetical protein
MKNNKFLQMALPFVIGAGFGLGIWALYSFSQALVLPPNPVAAKISVTDAHTYAQNYYNQAITPGDKIKGFTIDNAGLDAMNLIKGAAAIKPTGYRIYMGTDASGASLWVICGVDANGADMAGDLYSGKNDNVGLCPKICDIHSQIPGQ